MSAGTTVRSFRLSETMLQHLKQWGIKNLGTDNFSTIVRHLISEKINELGETSE